MLDDVNATFATHPATTQECSAPSSPFVDWLRDVRAAADGVEGSISYLETVLATFADCDVIPAEIWEATAAARTVLEVATYDVNCVIEDLVTAAAG